MGSLNAGNLLKLLGILKKLHLGERNPFCLECESVRIHIPLAWKRGIVLK